MGYTKHTLKGISWMSAGRFVFRSLSFVKIAVLARVLSPTQFGLFGIASLLLSLLETLTETGINVVLIQSKANLRDYINAAWFVSILRGIIIAVFIIVLSPLITFFFHAPDASSVILFISLVPFVRGFINPSEVKFQKELTFHLQFWFTSGLYLIDAITAVTFVIFTHSVNSIVWGMLISALFEVILSLVYINPRPKFAIDKGYFKDIFHKGIWVTGYTIFNYFAENLDNVVVGNVLGATSLGFYQIAYKISILPITEISGVISNVAFPVYAKIAGDTRRLKKALFKSVALVFTGSLFLGIIIFFFPEQIIHLILGDKWISIIPVLKILIIYGVLRTISGPVSALLLSLEKQKSVLVVTFVRFFTLAFFIVPFVTFSGLIGAGFAQLLSVIIELPVFIFFVMHAFKQKQVNT